MAVDKGTMEVLDRFADELTQYKVKVSGWVRNVLLASIAELQEDGTLPAAQLEALLAIASEAMYESVSTVAPSIEAATADYWEALTGERPKGITGITTEDEMRAMCSKSALERFMLLKAGAATLQETVRDCCGDTEVHVANVHSRAMDRFAKARSSFRYARVPSSGEACEFCATLASQGYCYKSAQSAAAGTHPHCSCLIVPGRDGSGSINGYWRDRYYAAKGQ